MADNRRLIGPLLPDAWKTASNDSGFYLEWGNSGYDFYWLMLRSSLAERSRSPFYGLFCRVFGCAPFDYAQGTYGFLKIDCRLP